MVFAACHSWPLVLAVVPELECAAKHVVHVSRNVAGAKIGVMAVMIVAMKARTVAETLVATIVVLENHVTLIPTMMRIEDTATIVA